MADQLSAVKTEPSGHLKLRYDNRSYLMGADQLRLISALCGGIISVDAGRQSR
jgi:hypothetical protein